MSDRIEEQVEGKSEWCIFDRMSSTIRRKGIKFSRTGSSVEIRTEPAIIVEIHRIIMSDGFQYFAAAE